MGFGALAPWVGGAGVPPVTPVKPGFRPHCWWAGGAGVPPPASVQPGYRSMLAWWVGGAGANITVGPPTPQPSGGGGVFKIPRDLREALRMRLIEEDDILLIIVASQFAKRLQ